MEGISKALRKFSGGNKSAASPSESSTMNGSAGAGEAMVASSSLSPPVSSSFDYRSSLTNGFLVDRKLCAFVVVAGVFFGYAVRRRV